jgi:hypothetical protein
MRERPCPKCLGAVVVDHCALCGWRAPTKIHIEAELASKPVTTEARRLERLRRRRREERA